MNTPTKPSVKENEKKKKNKKKNSQDYKNGAAFFVLYRSISFVTFLAKHCYFCHIPPSTTSQHSFLARQQQRKTALFYPDDNKIAGTQVTGTYTTP